MINIQPIEKYPENYDWLDSEQQIKIVSFMNGMQDLAERYYSKYITFNDSKYLGLYNHTMTSLTGSKNAYATLGIMCEYGWKNRPHEWILATKEDAEYYAEHSDEIDDYNEEIRRLLDYTDVGI